MIVLAFPPRALANNLVSVESLYGIFLPPSANALITIPSIERDLFILAASFSRSPLAPVLPTFSLPARSTRLMTDNLSIFRPSVVIIYFN